MLKDYVQPTSLILPLISGVRTRKNSYSLNTIPENTVGLCSVIMNKSSTVERIQDKYQEKYMC